MKRLIPLIASVAILAACSSPHRVASVRYQPTPQPANVTPAPSPTPEPADNSSLASQVIEEARTWLGVPYLYGGNDRNGIDCSGLMLQVFLNSCDIRLPRTSASQYDFCPNIAFEDLIPGDLVFFDTSADRNGRVSHVGLYIGAGEMIHASTSRGVIVTPLNLNYYSQRFIAGGRINSLHPSPQPQPRPQSTPQTQATPQPAPQPTQQPTQQSTPVAPSQQAAQSPRDNVLNSLIEQRLDSIFNY